MKKFLVLLMCLALAFMLVACGNSSDSEGTEPPANSGDASQGEQPGTQGSQSGNQGGVDFDLNAPPDPGFDSPATNQSDDSKLYTIIDDYAYELDPNTLEAVGPPLDPITHQPVDNPVFGGTNPSMGNNPQYNNDDTTEPTDTTTPPDDMTKPADTTKPEDTTKPTDTTKPDDSTKLPNTGEFLEDD